MYSSAGVPGERGKILVMIWSAGAWTATITLQFKPPGESEWHTFKTYTADIDPETFDQAFEAGTDWRIGCDTGDHTSGTIEVRLGA
jgi:hypothetical protein